MPLHMRLPKLKGFKNPNKVPYQVVSVAALGALFPNGGEVSILPTQVNAGAVRQNQPVKVLGNGETLSCSAGERHVFSQSAKDKLAAAGGTAVEVCQPCSVGWRRHFVPPDLRKKILHASLLAIYRLGTVIPTPGVDYQRFRSVCRLSRTTPLYGLINLFSGGALLQLSVFALGIMPYITASIIIQLLVVVIPRLEALKKEGQSGQAKLTQYPLPHDRSRGLAGEQRFSPLARTPGRLFQGCNEELIPDQSIPLILSMIIALTAGTALIMWFGELITDRGVETACRC